jgi:isopentenyl-diphosphate delta-isomerase
MSDIQKRKSQHIELAAREESQAGFNPFDAYQLPYVALPECSLDDVSTETTLLKKTLSQPLIIASMTGGSEHARMINTNLAIAAEKHRVALGVGSQRVALENTDAEDTFKLARKYAPTAVLFANMGAVQLNYGRGIEDYQRTVDMIEADALYLHLNPLQEAIQPEGDVDFSGLVKKIEKLVKKVSVPVYVKEVGHGIDKESAKQLIAAGVQGIDVAGVGGTSWAWIEAQRKNSPQFSEWFKEFGIPTDESLQEVASLKKKNVCIIASGGVRSPIDGLKARALGADYYSAAKPFLHAALESAEAVDDLLTTWRRGLQIALFVSGMKGW